MTNSYERYLKREEEGEHIQKNKSKNFILYIPKIENNQSQKKNQISNIFSFTDRDGEYILGKFATERDAEKSLADKIKKAEKNNYSLFPLETLRQAKIKKTKKRRG